MKYGMDGLIKFCRESGLRVTIGLRSILDVLYTSDTPQSLQDLEAHEKLSTLCDRATIFRTLQRLEAIGLLRRLNFSRSGAKFSLNTGASHQEYLICRDCGDVRTLEMSCPVKGLDSTLAEQTGFSEITHELTFYGLCVSCVKPKQSNS